MHYIMSFLCEIKNQLKLEKKFGWVNIKLLGQVQISPGCLIRNYQNFH